MSDPNAMAQATMDKDQMAFYEREKDVLRAEIKELKQDVKDAKAKVEKWQGKVEDATKEDKPFAKEQLVEAQKSWNRLEERLKQKEDTLKSVIDQELAAIAARAGEWHPFCLCGCMSAHVAVRAGPPSGTAVVTSGMCCVLMGVSSLFCVWSCC